MATKKPGGNKEAVVDFSIHGFVQIQMIVGYNFVETTKKIVQITRSTQHSQTQSTAMKKQLLKTKLGN